LLLETRTAIVYGAGGSIGGAVAEAFAREGANVHLVGRRTEPLSAVAEKIEGLPGRCEIATLDALEEDAVDAHADRVAEATGSIDISLNAISLGELFGTPLERSTLADFERPVLTAVRSTFLTARAAARHMVPRGSGVILTFGGYGRPLDDFALGGFQVALSAVDALRRQLAAELGPHGVRVLTIQSVGIPESFDSDADETPPRMLRRPPNLADVGNAAVFAASEMAAAMTGTTINITAGAEVD
jgi:3-oxoacyl-[acyl-carrier protein] reductase